LSQGDPAVSISSALADSVVFGAYCRDHQEVLTSAVVTRNNCRLRAMPELKPSQDDFHHSMAAPLQPLLAHSTFTENDWHFASLPAGHMFAATGLLSK